MQRFIFILLLIITPLLGISQLNTDHVIHTGRSRLYFGNYTGAIQSFNMVIKMKPHLPEPYFYRGVAKLNLEDFRGAQKDLQKAIEIKPFYPEAIMYRGVIHYNLGEYESAMNDYSKALILDGENADIYNNRGICKAAMRDFEGAIDDYSASINMKSKNFNAYLNRSIAYQILQKWDDAIKDCNQLIRIRPNSPMGYMSRGLIKIEKKDFAGALRDFDMAIYLDPRNAFAYQNRGMVKQQLESYDAAIMDYTTAINIDNRLAGAYFNRGIAKEMNGMGDYQKDYDYASLLDPRYAKRPWQTAQEREEQKNVAANQQQNNTASLSNQAPIDSIGTENKAINMDDLQKRKMKANLVVEDTRDIPGEEIVSSGKIQNRTIDIQLLPIFEIAIINKTDADDESVGYFNMVIENLNAKNNYEPYLTLTNHSMDLVDTNSKYNNQKLLFNARIKQNEEISDNYLYRGIFNTLTNTYKEGILDFNRAIEIDERNMLAYFMRANAKFKMSKEIESIINGPSLASDQNGKSLELFTKKENVINSQVIDEILTDYSVVIYMNPNFPFGYFNRGNIYCETESYYAAIDEYDKSIKIDPDFAEAYFNRGLVKILLNDIEGGAKDLSRAGELGIEESYNVIKRYCN